MNDTSTIFSQRNMQNLNKESPTPLYFQLYSLLKTLILDGTLAFSQRMPTEEELARTFSVSRITAKRAMDELANEDLVERRRGKGTHITYRYSPKPVKAPLTGMLEEIESMARNSSARVLECKMMQPPRAIREELQLEPGDTALHLVRVREREGRDFGYYISWTTGVKPPRSRKIFEKTPRITYFRDNGLELTHVTQTLSAVAAGPDVAEELKVPLGSPLLTLVRRSYNQEDGRELLRDYLQVMYNPEHFQYQMDLNIE